MFAALHAGFIRTFIDEMTSLWKSDICNLRISLLTLPDQIFLETEGLVIDLEVLCVIIIINTMASVFLKL